MKTNSKGFTIVELLVVIAVIAILAAISLVSYTGIRQKAHNAATITAVRQAVQILKLSYTANGTIRVTDIPSGALGICIGGDEAYPPSAHLNRGECYKVGSRADYFASPMLQKQLNTVGRLSFQTKELYYGGTSYGRGITYDNGLNNGSHEDGYFIYYDLLGPGAKCTLPGSSGDTNLSSWYDFTTITSCQINISKQLEGNPITY